MATLSNANLTGADLSGSNLNRTGLSSANLTGANLTGANLRGANFILANLSKTNLNNADLCWAYLLVQDISGAKYNQFTIWPDDFDPEAAGAQMDEEKFPDLLEDEENKKPSFGAYTNSVIYIHRFSKEPQWFWKIKKPTKTDEIEISNFLQTKRSWIDAEGFTVTVPITTLEQAIKEIAWSFAGTNIPNPEVEGTPIINNDAQPAVVEAMLLLMPREMIFEIWGAIGKAIPNWGSTKKNDNDDK